MATENKRLNIAERERVAGVLSGKYDPNSKRSAEILSRPHVAITLEAVLDEAGMTDDKIAEKVKNVLNRKAEVKMDRQGNITSNQTTVDNNVLQAARMLWQAKGKFVEKHEVGAKGSFDNLPDEQLDKLIEAGVTILGSGSNN